MEIAYYYKKCHCIDSDDNIEKIIQIYDNGNTCYDYVKQDYERVRQHCHAIYNACNNSLSKIGLTKLVMKKYTKLMTLLYSTFPEELSDFTPPVLEFEDGIDYNAPTYCGLYLVGETHFNPLTKEEFYWIKVGKAKNIANRMSQYNTCCPMLYRIGYLRCRDEREAYQMEKLYHDRLANVAIGLCNHNTEWFLMDKQTYLDICAYGFNYNF